MDDIFTYRRAVISIVITL